LKMSVFFLWGSTWQMSGRIGSLMPSKPWFRRSDSWLRRPSSSALAQRHLRFTEESTTRSLKVGCPATSYQHPPTTALGQFGSTCYGLRDDLILQVELEVGQLLSLCEKGWKRSH
jgi:hypothetical protein